MARTNESITVRGLDAGTKKRLRLRAAAHGHSMEEEVRRTIHRAVGNPEMADLNLAHAIAAVVEPIGGVDLDLPPRAPDREPPRFDWDDEEA